MAATHTIVSHREWITARQGLLATEKEFTCLREELSQARRDLPWEAVTTNYVFDGPNGHESLSDSFANHSQLVVYHFMFGPEWIAGCLHCSFWADNFNGIICHLNHRDVTMVAVSRAATASWRRTRGGSDGRSSGFRLAARGSTSTSMFHLRPTSWPVSRRYTTTRSRIRGVPSTRASVSLPKTKRGGSSTLTQPARAA
jgi:hypothetical protein